MSTEKKAFRTSMGGFNKDDVNMYILRQSREFKEKEENYKKEIEKLSCQIEVMNIDFDEIETLREKLSKITSDTDEYEKKISEYKFRIEELEKALAEKSAEASKDDKAPDFNKIRMYDQLSSQIGEIIIGANKNADDVIKKAETAAKKLLEESEKNAIEAKARLQVAFDSIISGLRKDIEAETDSCIKEFRSYTQSINSGSQNMIAEIEKRYSEMSDKITSYSDALEDSVKSRVSTLIPEADTENKSE
ncbi:MAG: hypothetical protein HFE30_00635 [Clostridiales bacterium]|nr:hypothetical protein [Clostridiales bacterium]